jgi:hypothetical protein
MTPILWLKSMAAVPDVKRAAAVQEQANILTV